MTFHPQTDGQTEVVNKMIIDILHMYNMKHPCTWGESLPYVQTATTELSTAQQAIAPFR